MAHEILCPNGHKLQVTEAHFGRQVRCPTCGEPFMVPDLSAGAGGAEGQEQPAAQQPAARPARRASAGSGFEGFCTTAGHPLLMIGIILVVAARGCDTLGRKDVLSVQAKSSLAQNRFNDRYEAKQLDLQQRYNTLAKADTRDTKALADVQKEMTDLSKEQVEERQKLQIGEWRRLGIAARDADASNRTQGYWRELAFLLGTLSLTIGLLAVGFTAHGAERWICLLMLAIITFSIYVFGVPWMVR